jgi:threonine dehydratase
MFSLDSLKEAVSIVRAIIPPTPQISWPQLAEHTGCRVWVKHENHTCIGAFKVRGGIVYVDSLKKEPGNFNGIISATRGNHGQSLAFAGGRAGLPVTLVVPRGNSVEKNAAMRSFGADVIEEGNDFDQAREKATQLAESRNLRLVPPFHQELVRGVATYAFELFSAIGDLDVVYVPIGMGSGICGLIHTRNLLGLKTEIVGVVSSHAPAFALSFAAGRVITTETADTFADGMACRVPLEEVLQIVQKGASRIVSVTDNEIEDAIRLYYSTTHNLAEGAGAASLAALLQEKENMRGKHVGVVLSGCNIDRSVFSRMIAQTA